MHSFSKREIQEHKEYLMLLSEKYKNPQQVRSRIIDLNSLLCLPKGTEHFITDIHGENEAFEHVLRNCSGSIKRKVTETIGDKATKEEINTISTLIYYPNRKLNLIKQEINPDSEWYKKTINYLIEICRVVSSKYPREKVRKSLNKNFVNIMEELLNKDDDNERRKLYYENVINTIVDTNASCDFITELCQTIRILNLDHLHIIGDIYDRGRGADKVMKIISDSHSVDIQWGNHDVLWMGAGLGCEALIATALRISLRYANIAFLKNGYGIDLLPLTFLAQNAYKNDTQIENFYPRFSDERPDIEPTLLAKMHKAIAIIQFKLESILIKKYPKYNLQDRDLLNKCDFENNTVTLEGKTYHLNTTDFPTIDKNDPTRLTKEERHVINSLKTSFLTSEKLQKHIQFLLNKGSIYLTYNDNLLFHGSIPLTKEGLFNEIEIDGEKYKGKALLDIMDKKLRKSASDNDDDKSFFYYMWLSPNSPLFGKNKMATFERYFIDDKEIQKEKYLSYYTKSKEYETACYILKEFSLTSPNSHIINGHVPIKTKDGQSPVEANGKLLLIDGGYSKAYQAVTGVAGITLTYNSHGLNVITHEPFESIEKAVEDGIDIKSERRFVSTAENVILNASTDIAKDTHKKIYFLEMLLTAYLNGDIKPLE